MINLPLCLLFFVISQYSVNSVQFVPHASKYLCAAFQSKWIQLTYPIPLCPSLQHCVQNAGTDRHQSQKEETQRLTEQCTAVSRHEINRIKRILIEFIVEYTIHMFSLFNIQF